MFTVSNARWQRRDPGRGPKRPDARPIGIAVDGSNNVWYADLSGWLGRLDASRARAR
jgi:hypothetical protein